ncbi:hypothetical protein KGP96_30930, partial [Burkholderia multivorans]|uniref:hypothetical protein n=1 Tax=Burkholderia multivorans TaxID=87883 RepID=UPI00209D4249
RAALARRRPYAPGGRPRPRSGTRRRPRAIVAQRPAVAGPTSTNGIFAARDDAKQARLAGSAQRPGVETDR